MKNRILPVMVLLFMLPSLVWADVAFLRFGINPSHAIQVETRTGDTGEKRVFFCQCAISETAEGLTPSSCEQIGSELGYTADALRAQHNLMRRNRWLVNSVALTAGTTCGAILGATAGGLLIAAPLMMGGATGLSTGILGMFFGLKDSATNFVNGVMYMVAAQAAIYTSGLAGAILGPIGSWKLSKKLFHPYKQSQAAISPLLRLESQPAVDIWLKGSLNAYRDNLEKALEPLNMKRE